MKIIGLDPGIARLGWGIIRKDKSQLEPIAFDCISTSLKHDEPTRLLELHNQLQLIFTKYTPDAVAIESLFFAKNAKTAIAVGQARGVILLTAAQNHAQIFSYTPLQVKQTLTGNGHADKKQVASMVTRLLQMPATPTLDDTTDALAIAITHAAMYKMKAATHI